MCCVHAISFVSLLGEGVLLSFVGMGCVNDLCVAGDFLSSVHGAVVQGGCCCC